MNREQRAVAFVATILVLVILGLLGGTLHLWKKSQLPTLPPSLQRAAQGVSPPSLEGSTPARLYYFDPQRDSLVRLPVSLPVRQRPENLPELVRVAWERLGQHGAPPGFVSPLPEASEIVSVFVDAPRGALYLNLNEAHFRNHPGGTIEGWATVYAIVNTVCSLSPSIEQVFLLRQGRLVREGPGGWDYSQPFRPDETLVRDPSGAATGQDAQPPL